MNMDISPNGLALIELFEGWVPHVYKDVVGIATIGYGHVVKPGESFPATITKEQGQELLHKDVGLCIATINSHVKVDINQNQFDALCSFAFNVGNGALESSTLLKKLNAGDTAGAALEFPKWSRAGGVANKAILARRNKEMALFNKPVQAPIDSSDVVTVAAEEIDPEETDPTLPTPDSPEPTTPMIPAPTPSESSNANFMGELQWILLCFGFFFNAIVQFIKHFK